MKWYSWKFWRIAWAPNHSHSHVVEGNNRWKRVFKNLFWRYDSTKSHTKS